MMRHSSFTLVALAGLISALALGQTVQTPVAQENISQGVPRLVKFSSLLRGASGNLLTDTVGITFAVYGEQTGGVPLWQETHNIQFSQGRYTVFLGENTSGGISIGVVCYGPNPLAWSEGSVAGRGRAATGAIG